MTANTPDPAMIAKRMTDGQINALLYPSGYHAPNSIKALRRKGLWHGGLPTELGVALRTILKEQNHDQG